MILERLNALLSDPQGSLAYHLIATFTIGLIFLMAQVLRWRTGAGSLRWSLASGPLAAARLGMLLLAGSTALAAPELAPMLSPLERYLAVAGGLVLAWAFLIPIPQQSGDLAFGAALAVCSLGLAVSAIPLAIGGTDRPSSMGGVGLAWDLAGLLAMLAVVVLLLVRRPNAWPAAAGGMALLGLGFALQLAAGSSEGASAAPLRFAELLAYPAISAGAAWALAGGLHELRLPAAEPDSAESGARRPEVMPAATLRGLEAAANTPSQLKGAEDTEQVAQLKAEFRLALQELADLSRERSEPGPAESLPMPVVGSLGDVVQGMRRALTSVMSCAELLGAEAGGQIEAEPRRLLDRLQGDVLQLSALVNKLGELTTETAAHATSGASEADLQDCLRAALDRLAGTIQQKQLSLALDFPQDLPPVRARQADLERLLVMMIESSIASTHPGTQVEIRAHLERMPAGGLISLSVTDSGEGFPPEEVAQAFQPWHQLEGPTSGGTRAFGISLAGLRKAAEHLGGRVWVASELGTGTTLTVLLPTAATSPNRE